MSDLPPNADLSSNASDPPSSDEPRTPDSADSAVPEAAVPEAAVPEAAVPEALAPDTSPGGAGLLAKVAVGARASMAALDRFALHAFDVATSWCWPVVYGLFVSVGAWWWTHDAERALVNNRLNDDLRRSCLAWAGAGALIGLVSIALLATWKRWRGRDVATSVRAVNLALAPCLTIPALLALFSPKIETERPLLAASLPLLVALGWLPPLYQMAGRRWPLTMPRWTARTITGLVLVGGWAAYGAFFSHAAILNHHGLMTSTFDLGLYDNIFYQSSHGTFLGCSFLRNNYHGAAHFDPILVLISPLYLLYPRAESILVMQSFWLGAGVFPLYALARRRLESRVAAVLFALSWLVYPALHGANMYDFHSLALIAPLIVWLWYCIEVESRVGFWVCVALALLTREDVPLLLCFICAAMIASRKPFQVRNAWPCIVVSVAYFLVAKLLFMGSPDDSLRGTQTYTFDLYYKELIPNGTGIGEIISSLITNPGFVVRLLFGEKKILFLLLVFVPLGLLPALARPGRIALVYGLAFCLLATREPVFSIYFQYVALVFAVAFPLTLHGLDAATTALCRQWPFDPVRVRRAAVGALLVCTALVSVGFGGLVENDAFHGGFSRPIRHLTDHQRERYAWVQQAVAMIPADATVAATRRMGPHISNRSKAYGYPNRGSFDYLFVDESQIPSKQMPDHRRFVQQGGYEVLTRLEKLVLYGRKRS